MTDVTIGANQAKMLEIAQKITEQFSGTTETSLEIPAEDENGNWLTLTFDSSDTDRDDWNDELVIVEVEHDY
jgi:hypothetical protein